MVLRITLLCFLSIVCATSFSQFLNPEDAPDHKKFDFWVGQWDVNLKVKQEDKTWKDQHKAIANIYSILDGKAVLELWSEGAEGIIGYSLRYFNDKEKRWDLWLNWPPPNQSSMSTLSGNFNGNKGEFFREYTVNDGTKRISRYTFSDITPVSLKWQDGYSRDNGNTWSSNWIMEFSRSDNQAPSLSSKRKANTYYKGKRCNLMEFEKVNQIAGYYSGEKKAQKAEIIKVLDGCMTIGFIQNLSNKFFFSLTYDSFSEAYELIFLNNESGIPAKRLYGQNVDDFMVFNDKEGDDNASILMSRNKLQMAIRYLGDNYRFQLQRK